MMRLLRSGDSGFTIVELVVSIALTSVVLTMVGSFFVTVSKAASAAQTSRSAVGAAADAMDEIREVLREGCQVAEANGTSDPAVVSGTATSLTVTALVDTSATTPAPTKVSLGLNGSGYLVETRIAGVSSGGVWTFTGTPSSRTIAGPVSTTSPLTVSFAYSNANGGALTPGGSGLTASQRAAVAFVTATVTVPTTTYGSSTPPVTLTNQIDIPDFAVTAS